ncbi:acylneuraminate cytidylyltransferase family protein [SAR202 cluster bacterium AD-812-D07_MRT_10900m]|nr:acylneuraminate cytidylyltransferase family protein [SAR202 cluster bacterium AD-812-D07_MRT_10900m]
MTEVLAIVPARSGSKGLPRKNLRPLAGHPLIAYSVAAGLQATLVDRVICSTDSEEIADVARQYGAEVPFMRPAELAQDDSPDIDAFQHVLYELQARENYRPDIIVQLRPTSPIRQPGQVDTGVETLLNNPGTDSIRAVTPSPATPYKMWRIKSDILTPLLTLDGVPEPFNMPRQALPEVWWQTGTLEIIRTSVIESGSMTGSEIRPFVIDPEHAVDIDLIESFARAERIIASIECVKPTTIES